MPDRSETPVPTRGEHRARGCWAIRLQQDPTEHLATDLSAGGLFVLGVTDHQLGDHVAVEIDLDGTTLGVTATVRWVRPHRIGPGLLAGCGLSFDPLPEGDRALLLATLRAMESA